MIMLDKDTLVKGNKLYSKETCCLISHADSNRDVAERHPEILKKHLNQLSQSINIQEKSNGFLL